MVGKTLTFRFSGKMARLLGRESVSSEIAALFELVKNGYDADAEQVTITFENFAEMKGKNGRIIIKDNGDGMTVDDLENKWMVIGTASKERLPVSRRKKRNVTGNKGIGRFATEKLSEKTTLISKSYSTTEAFQLSVNWSDYEQINVTFDKVPNNLTIIPKPTQKNGTTIILEKLRDIWTDEKIMEVKTALSSLVLPTNLQKINDDKFDVKIFAKDFNISRLTSIESSLFDVAPYRIESVIGSDRNSGNIKIFRLGRLQEISFDFSDKELDNGEAWKTFGKCKVVIYFYPKSTKYEDWDTHYRKHGMKLKLLSTMLEQFHGVKIYRDGFWIRPYGERENDWLNLEQKRVQSNLRVGNSQIIGFVEISKDSNPGIIDTTTRERLVENISFFSMRQFVQEIFNMTYYYREKQHAKYKEKDTKIIHEASINSEINRMKNTILEFRELKHDHKQTLQRSMQDISKIFKNFKGETSESIRQLKESERIYRNIAALGISTTSAVHEIGHVLPHVDMISKNIDHALKAHPDVYKIVKNDLQRVIGKINVITHFTTFVITFAGNFAHDIEIKQKAEKFDVKNTINQTMSDLLGFFKSLNIDFIIDVKQANNEITMNKFDFQSILLNLLSNSIRALEKIPSNKSKHIKITVSDEKQSFNMKFSDNGIGIKEINKSKIFEMFYTTSKRGTGLGLSIITEILQEYGGKIELLDKNEFEKDTTFYISIPIERLQ